MIPVRVIQQAVSAEFRVGVDEMLSHDKHPLVVQARGVAMYLAREHQPPKRVSHIARVFGRHPSTALVTIQRIGERIAASERLAAKVERVREALR